MVFGIMTWLSKYDQFGSFAKFNYRGESGYGTGAGGFCSLCLTLMTTVLIGTLMFGFFYDASYNQQSTTIYLTADMGDTSYQMKPGDFIPTYWAYTIHDFEGEKYETYNDPALFDIYYNVTDKDDHPDQRVEAILCTEFFTGPIWKKTYTEAQIQNALEELEEPLYQLCPDIDGYLLRGGTRSKTAIGFRFVVDPLAGASEDYISDTVLYTSMISQYFTPPLYDNLGFMQFISVTESLYDLKTEVTTIETLEVSLDDITYYTFPIFDTSQVSIINFGSNFKDYKVDNQQVNRFINRNNRNALFVSQLVQSRMQQQVGWSIVSIDLILGLVGGITSIAWSTLGMIMAPYEDFKFNTSLASSMYPTSPQRDEDEGAVGSRKEAQSMMEGTVIERGKFGYNFGEYYVTWFLEKLCCCCLNRESRRWRERQFRYNRYESAVENLNEEIDILKHVSNQRVGGFLAKLFLRKHQRALVQSFRRYQLDDMTAQQEAEKVQQQNFERMTDTAHLDVLLNDDDVDQEDTAAKKFLNDERLTKDQKKLLMEIRSKFDVEEIVADLCILYETTGFQDESADKDFWDQYMDFFELGNDDNSINSEKKGDVQTSPGTNRRNKRRQSMMISHNSVEQDIPTSIQDGNAQ